MAAEQSLADLIPLWRTLREDDTTVLVTPALDYVGAVELGGVDLRFAADDQVAGLGEALRSLVSSLEDGSVLHLVQRSSLDQSEAIAAYEKNATTAPEVVLQEYVRTRAAWLGTQPMRSTRLTLFFSPPPAAGALAASPFDRGALGLRLPWAKPEALSQAAHAQRVTALKAMRDRLTGRLAAAGLMARELDLSEVHRLHHDFLNPGRLAARLKPPPVALRDNLWEPTGRDADLSVLELTEAEQLVLEDLEEHRGRLTLGGTVHRRVATLRVLPEGATTPGLVAPLGRMVEDGPDGPRPFAFWLTTTVRVLSQSSAKFRLNARHGLVEALRGAFPFLQGQSVQQATEQAAQQEGIQGLFRELADMSSKLVEVSTSIALDASTVEQLDRRTEVTRAAFSDLGNAELLLEDVSQLPCMLAMLPGSARYQVRSKGVTSRNAADLLPIAAPWRGTDQVSSLFPTPDGDALQLHLFDKALATAHHGLIVADTGSGKSVALGALVLDALAASTDAILIDNGGSWRPLTELLGGTHISVDLKTSISPFASFDEVVGRDGQVDPEQLSDVVQFLEVCVQDRTLPGFDKVQADLVGRAVRRAYEALRSKPSERPLIGQFRQALVDYPAPTPEDRSAIDQVVRRLGLFVDGVYAEFLNRPSKLRFDARLLTFDLAQVSKTPTTKAIAMATVIQAVTARAAQRRKRTLVAVDEGHEHLGQDDVGERFLAGCYRKMRKFDVAMWMISQRFSDFTSAKAGAAIVGNSPLRLFLRHGSGHGEVARYFGFSPRALAAFEGLQFKPGRHSDLLLMYGARMATVRMALHPFAYWVLTTDPEDLRLLAASATANPSWSRLQVLRELAARYPRGSARGRAA